MIFRVPSVLRLILEEEINCGPCKRRRASLLFSSRCGLRCVVRCVAVHLDRKDKGCEAKEAEVHIKGAQQRPHHVVPDRRGMDDDDGGRRRRVAEETRGRNPGSHRLPGDVAWLHR